MEKHRGPMLVRDLLRSLELRPEEGREGWTFRLLDALARSTGAAGAYLGTTATVGWTRLLLREGRIRPEAFPRLHGLAERMATSQLWPKARTSGMMMTIFRAISAVTARA